ncbi:hypothetical protein GCM10020218_099900 [Dactylosporangium vinaceum]
MAVGVPLVSAVVAAVTALVTQSLIRRRDDVRWERERAERREQWAREDAARWLADRRSAYADLLTARHEHDTLAAALQSVGRPGDADRARLRELAAAANRAAQAVLLIAPPPVTAAVTAGDPVALLTAMRDDLGVAPQARTARG